VELLHHPLGASGGKTWLQCTWAPQMQLKFPDEESSFAAHGTAAHFITEWARNDNKPASHYLGHVIKFERQDATGDWEFECDQEMVDAVQMFLDYVYSLPTDLAQVEERLGYGTWVDSDELGPAFGTVDDARVDITLETVYITDFKYGKGVPVVARDNWQLWLYALAWYETYGHIYEVETFVVAIVQPRNGGITTDRVTLDFLLNWAETFVRPRADQAASETEGVYRPGTDACRFCRARNRCRARAGHVFSVIDPDYPNLGNNELAMILPHISDMRRALDGYEAAALEEVQNGRPVGDYKLVAGKRGNRAWRDQEEAAKALGSRAKATGGKLKKDELYPPGNLISPSAAEKLLGKDHPIIQATEKTGDVVRKIDSAFIGRSDGKPVLVPGDDPRTSLAVVAEDEFSNVEGD